MDETAWRRDIADAYKLFATKHVDNLTSRQILEAAFAAMRERAGSSVPTPAFSDVADFVAEDQTRFDAATDQIIRERPEVPTDDLRTAAIKAMVQILPDGHTLYFPVWEESPIRDLVEGRCEVRSELLAGGIGLVQWSGWVRSEQFDILNELRARLDELLRNGVRAWLFDLRGNHGGAGATDAMGMFLDGEAAYRARYRGGRTEVIRADRSLRLPAEYQLPIAIAVDSGTWSASEMLAFGLQQYGRATVVGEQTAGFVGSVDGVELSGKAWVGVNTRQLTGPNGEMYNGVGVKPDIDAKSANAVDAASRYLRGLVPSVLKS